MGAILYGGWIHVLSQSVSQTLGAFIRNSDGLRWGVAGMSPLLSSVEDSATICLRGLCVHGRQTFMNEWSGHTHSVVSWRMLKCRCIWAKQYQSAVVHQPFLPDSSNKCIWFKCVFDGWLATHRGVPQHGLMSVTESRQTISKKKITSWKIKVVVYCY